jgi:HEAT repeat protein
MSDEIHWSWADDTRSTADLVKCALATDDEDEYWSAIAALHFRAGPEEVAAGIRLCQSLDADERRIGVNILAQLGWEKPTFLDETVPVLIERLADSDEDVIAAAGIALGQRGDPRAIPHLIQLKSHLNPDIRFGVIRGLSCQSDPAAIAALIELSADSADHNRDWATFALATLVEVDTPELRSALLARLADAGPEVRGEALIGLAQRGDQRVVAALQRELQGEFSGSWALEAAEIIADPVLHPHLQALYARLDEENRSFFGSNFATALAACAPPVG